jgi:hypothetical protein
MDGNQESPLVKIYLNEYDKLKQEQIARIGFRDNLIYATLIALTAVISIVADDITRMPVLLVLPVVCITLGWTYLVNDEKISAIGRYLRITVSDKVRELIGNQDPMLFGWEIAHRSDNRRSSRKVIQFIVDQFLFIVPGIIAIVIFWINSTNMLTLLRWIAGIELLFLLALSFEIFSYADFKRGR